MYWLKRTIGPSRKNHEDCFDENRFASRTSWPSIALCPEHDRQPIHLTFKMLANKTDNHCSRDALTDENNQEANALVLLKARKGIR